MHPSALIRCHVSKKNNRMRFEKRALYVIMITSFNDECNMTTCVQTVDILHMNMLEKEAINIE